MADQPEPPENRRDRDQALSANDQAGQRLPIGQYPGEGQRFVAPAESFGSFGPLPDYPPGEFYGQPQFSPTPFTPTPTQTTGAGNPSATTLPAANPAPFTPNSLYTPASLGANPYLAPGTPGAMPYAPYGMYAPPFSAPVPAKKPLLFPLTRKMPALLQIFGMLLYSLVIALGIMGCILTLLRAFITNSSVYANPDGSANGLSILLTLILVLLLVPAGSLLSGALFGSWRGLIVSLLSLGGGFLLAHVSDPRFGNPDATLLNYLPFAAPVVAALAVGLVYDHRKYAAWWKSMFTMFLGTAVLLIWFFAGVYLLNANSGGLNILAANSHMALQNYLAYMGIALGCFTLFAIPVLGLFFAGLEGIIHSIVARIIS